MVLKNHLKNLRNKLHFWKTVGEKPCPACKLNMFRVEIEEKVITPANIFSGQPSKRVVLRCANCDKRYYPEEYACRQ